MLQVLVYMEIITFHVRVWLVKMLCARKCMLQGRVYIRGIYTDCWHEEAYTKEVSVCSIIFLLQVSGHDKDCSNYKNCMKEFCK